MAYEKSPASYDAVYKSIGKDYLKESEKVRDVIALYKKSKGNAMLDVACGTGKHLEYLQRWFEVEGLDLNEQMLILARERLPRIIFHRGNMIDFDLKNQYDAVVCLFSSIGYVQTSENLNRAIAAMTKHVLAGGVLVVEPWFKPGDWKENYLHATFVDEPDLKVSRMSISSKKGNLSIMKMDYTVATIEGVEHFKEVHQMGLFTHEEQLDAFRRAGLEVHYDEEGLMGRGLYIGVKI